MAKVALTGHRGGERRACDRTDAIRVGVGVGVGVRIKVRVGARVTVPQRPKPQRLSDGYQLYMQLFTVD